MSWTWLSDFTFTFMEYHYVPVTKLFACIIIFMFFTPCGFRACTYCFVYPRKVFSPLSTSFEKLLLTLSQVLLRIAWAQDLGSGWAVDPVWTSQSPHSGNPVSDTTQSSQSESFFSIFKLQLGREGSFSSWVKDYKDMNPKLPLVCEVNSWTKWSRDQSWKVLTYVLYNLVFCIWWMKKHISEQTYILARGWVAGKE